MVIPKPADPFYHLISLNLTYSEEKHYAVIKFNLNELFRMRWMLALIFLEGILYCCILLFEPAASDMTAILLQIGFLLNLFFGSYYASRLSDPDYREMLDTLKPALPLFIGSSIVTIVLVNLIHLALLSVIAVILYLIGHLPAWLMAELLRQNFIYFFINQISSALLGYLIGYLITHRLKYLILISVSFLISPVSKLALPYVRFIALINLGPANFNIAPNYLYGFDTEITCFFHFSTFCLLLLTLLSILVGIRLNRKKVFSLTFLLLILTGICAWQWTQPAWLRRPFYSNGSPLAESVYDSNYYRLYQAPDPADYPVHYLIREMKIDPDDRFTVRFVCWTKIL